MKSPSPGARPAPRRPLRSYSLWFAGAFAALAAAPPPASAQEEALRVAASRETGLDQPTTLMVVDLFHTETPEIVATDVRGTIAILNGEDGETILSTNVGAALTGAVAADFLGDGSLDLLVGTDTGSVLLFDGSSLELLVERDFSQDPFRLPATVVPLRQGPQLDAPSRDVAIMTDMAGKIYAVGARRSESGVEILELLWDPKESGTSIPAPGALGGVRQANGQDVIFGTGDGRLLFLNPATGDMERIVAKEGQPIPGIPLLLRLDGDERMDIVLVYENAQVEAFTYRGTNKIEPLWGRAALSLGSRPLSDPVLAEVGGERVVFVATQGNLMGFKLTDAMPTVIRGNEREFADISTQLSIVPSPVGYPHLAFGVGRELRLLDTTDWLQRGLASTSMARTPVDDRLTHTVGVYYPAPTDGTEPTARLAALSVTTGRLTLADTNRSAVAGMYAPWMTRAATPERPSQATLEYFRRDLLRRERLQAERARQEQLVETAAEAGEWREAFLAAEWLKDFDPLNPDYAKQSQRLWVRKNLLFLIAGFVAILLITVLVLFALAKILMLRRLDAQARTAAAAGRLDEARALYEKLHAKVPNNPRVISTLAGVYLSQRSFTKDSIPVLEKAVALDSENATLRHALARAMLAAGRTDNEAMGAYDQALRTEFPEPQLMEYAIGLCLKERGEHEAAGKRLRAALRGGLTRDEVYSALCDVYLTTGTHTTKALPVFKQQFAARQDDPRFLAAYLDSCVDAKKTDGEVERLCQLVLEDNPRSIPALCHLATIRLQNNNLDKAVDAVQQALAVEPQNNQAVALLASCYLLQGRTDRDAVNAYRAALAINPRDPEVLRVLTDVYFRAGRYDQEAVDVYRRSGDVNPNDGNTLRALAQTAKLSSNADLTIQSIEALNQQGMGSPDLNAQLANAYVAKGIFEPRTERVVREALRARTGDATLQAALARVLALQDREDAEASAVYAQHLLNRPDDLEIGLQLAKSYIRGNRYQDADALARGLLEKHPGSEELKRLLAQANLYGNKVDQAIEEYTRILSTNANDREARINLALAYGQKGRTDEAAARVYRTALETSPDNAELHLAMGRTELARGDQNKAVEHYQKALKASSTVGGAGFEEPLVRHLLLDLNKHPEAARVRWFLCEVLVAYGRFREALEQLEAIHHTHPQYAKNLLGALEKILAKDPKNVPALAQKGKLLAAQGDFNAARKALEDAYKLQPNNPTVGTQLVELYGTSLEAKDEPEVRFRLGKLHFLSQEYDKAIGCFQKTAQDYRWEAESTKMLGKCFMAKGMLDIALQEFKKLVVDDETKDLLYELAQRYETKKDLVGAKTVYRQLFAADIDYKDVKTRFEMLSGSTSDPMAFEKTSVVEQMSEGAQRRYELLNELGRGAMGIVYKAKDKELEEVVALKILPDSMSNNPEAVRRFKIEARNARKLSHPNIVRIHDIGEEMGRKYISMELVDGSDLKKKVKTQGRLSLGDTFRYGIAIAEALGYAHRLGIVHRDIKPANIMLNSNDDVKVTDFGIAKMLDQTAEGTMMGAVIGTPLYMSPEQVQGIPVDNRADLYAFGIMLYEFINGRPPFTEGDLAYQHMHREPTRPADCPDELWAIIAKCLEKDKHNRWDKAEDIVEALKAAQKVCSGV